MNLTSANYKEVPMAVTDGIGCSSKKIMVSPLSKKAVEYIESLDGTIETKHRTQTGYEKFSYSVTFPHTKYGLSIIKGYGTYGSENDQFEVGITYDGHLSYDTDITGDVEGHLEEEDVLAIVRLVLRLDEEGHIKPLETEEGQ